MTPRLPVVTSDHRTPDRLDQQIRFILEIDKLKQVLRRSYLTDGSRLENDAEHSWHLAMLAVILGEYASETDLDTLRALKMILIHDLVEIDAGDSFLYDSEAAKSKVKNEQAAADRIFALLPDDQAAEVRSLWDEFEAGATPEARYVRALDRLQPVLLNISAHGRTWKEHGITAEQAIDTNVPIVSAGAPSLGDHTVRLLSEARESGFFHASPEEDTE